MKTAKTMMSLLLLSAVCVTPAYANWFSNSRTNTMLNIGSAPNPTPADLRAIGDSDQSSGPQRGGAIPHSSPSFGEPRRGGLSFNEDYVAPQQSVIAEPAAVTPKKNVQNRDKSALNRMEGKTVFGAHGARLGTILAMDVTARKAEVQLPSGIAVAMPASMLTDKGKRVVAPTISPLDMMAMAKTQTGHTVAINVDSRHLRDRTSRG
ncbi:MAG TPA: hypothetical protein VNH44_00815 [Micropepsaceae bacterium]|nr:hypothetical protein [Micropepsaceae bacterium]